MLRQPRLVASLVLGPFVVMLLFGLGYRGPSPEFRTILVLPDDPALSDAEEIYREGFGGVFNLDEVTRDEQAAVEALQNGEAEAVVIVPDDILEKLSNGDQPSLRVLFIEIDPNSSSWVRYFASNQIGNLNRRILLELVEQARAQAAGGAALLDEGQQDVENLADLARRLAQVPPERFVSPLGVETENLAPIEPTIVAFYAPAVLALLLQHIGVTLTMFSSVRDRSLGSTELFRVSPVGPGSILLGKSLGYGIMLALVGVVLSLLVIGLLGVPALGSMLLYALSLFLTIFASVALGLALSFLAASESQAIQLSLLLLLLTVFLGGFVLPLDLLVPWVRTIAYLLPSTYGATDLRTVMLLGETPLPRFLLGPLGLGCLFFLLALLGMRRELRRA